MFSSPKSVVIKHAIASRSTPIAAGYLNAIKAGSSKPAPVDRSNLLLENGRSLVLENGGKLLLEK